MRKDKDRYQRVGTRGSALLRRVIVFENRRLETIQYDTVFQQTLDPPTRGLENPNWGSWESGRAFGGEWSRARAKDASIVSREKHFTSKPPSPTLADQTGLQTRRGDLSPTLPIETSARFEKRATRTQIPKEFVLWRVCFHTSQWSLSQKKERP